MHGFLNIDKPRGITSFGVIEELRNKLGIKKMGHAGNLDPDATGVLVVGVGKGTRFLEFIMDLEKEYMATIKLGVLTDTLDMTGEVIDEKPVPELSETRLRKVLKGFLGDIMQTPPAYSAIRVEGKRLYELAREGVYVKPKPRRVRIHRIELLGLAGDEFMIRVVCSKGTYIRSLARDIGEKLGTYGVVKELRRTRVGHFRVENAVPLDADVERLKSALLKIDEGLSHLKEVILKEKAARYFQNGTQVGIAGILRKSPDARSFEHVRVYRPDGRFIGVGYLRWDSLSPVKVLPPDFIA